MMFLLKKPLLKLSKLLLNNFSCVLLLISEKHVRPAVKSAVTVVLFGISAKLARKTDVKEIAEAEDRKMACKFWRVSRRVACK